MNNRDAIGNLPLTYDANRFPNIFISKNSNVNVFVIKSGEESVTRHLEIDVTRTTSSHEPTTSVRYASSSRGLPPHAQQMGADGGNLLNWVNASASGVPLGQHRNGIIGIQPQVCHPPNSASPTNSDRSFDSGFADCPGCRPTMPNILRTEGATARPPPLDSTDKNQYSPIIGICAGCLMQQMNNNDSINKVD